MRAKTLANFYRQFATMVNAGMSHGRSLQVLVEQHRGGIRRVAKTLQAVVGEGHTLSEGMAVYPKIFPALHINLIRAGEQSGRLDEVMHRLADSLEKGVELRMSVLFHLIYPAIVVHLAILVRAVVYYFQVGAGAALMYLAKGFVFVYGVTIGLWLLFTLCRQLPPTRYVIDLFAFHTPVIRGIVRNLGAARFARTMEAMYNAGFNMGRNIEQSAQATGNEIMEARVRRAVPLVKEGVDVGAALTTTQAFSPMVNGMLQTGAESGRLDQMLLKVAENAEEEAARAIKVLGIVIPIFVMIGIFIWLGFMIISMFSGYIDMLNELLE